MSVVTLSGNPDGVFYRTEFDSAIWEKAKELSHLVKHQAEVVNKKTLPSVNWISSFIYAFASVAYKHKKIYDRKDYSTWWLPSIRGEAPELENITKIFDRDKMEVAMTALRELREKGKVPDLIWMPWTNKTYSHVKTDVIDRITGLGSDFTSFATKLALISFAIYIAVPVVTKTVGGIVERKLVK